MEHADKSEEEQEKEEEGGELQLTEMNSRVSSLELEFFLLLLCVRPDLALSTTTHFLSLERKDFLSLSFYVNRCTATAGFVGSKEIKLARMSGNRKVVPVKYHYSWGGLRLTRPLETVPHAPVHEGGIERVSLTRVGID